MRNEKEISLLRSHAQENFSSCTTINIGRGELCVSSCTTCVSWHLEARLRNVSDCFAKYLNKLARRLQIDFLYVAKLLL